LTQSQLKGTDTFTGQNTALLSKIDPIEDLQRCVFCNVIELVSVSHPLTDSNTPKCRTTATVHYPVDGSQCGYTGESQHSGVSKVRVGVCGMVDRRVVVAALDYLPILLHTYT
jgi:hypothetical protein